jgi:hypothetical protein
MCFVQRIAGIGNGRRDDVCSTCPLSQVDSATTLAAKGKIWISFGYTLLAGRTAQFLQTTSSRHGLLQDSGNQVVIVGFGDLTAIELADFRLNRIRHIVDINFAVNFWCMHGRSRLV